jgi:hypothetical protein
VKDAHPAIGEASKGLVVCLAAAAEAVVVVAGTR